MSDFADKSFDMIEKLQDRIAELEGAWNKAQDRNAKLEQTLSIMIDSNRKDLHALTIERKRREECEAELKETIAGLEAELRETIASSDRACDSYAQENQRFYDALIALREDRSGK